LLVAGAEQLRDQRDKLLTAIVRKNVVEVPAEDTEDW
jgi:hypothetical protein